ncbi:Ribosomal RNA small subunit methyltransferase E [Rhodopirellula maiorica SM1]|uniref:Ribosomal RNA small subunit methyltransferase E n=1 Tax=Rhodopirellula maiorica SM1 TaxID=1265738 RepID=M5RFW1_9BACT|nr:RsmE family RNA methyltransferase [Rhodopirellula maiorica]EMI18275.1 Ribosomal RNA small subunit methyltransferase E [Rhodopirellula maiorica SM1]
MTRRYYCSNLPSNGGSIVLADAEAQHAIRVMRVKTGDSITLFDGTGSEAEAVIDSITRRECFCTTQPPTHPDREPQLTLHLGIALPKPDRCRELVERLTEIGVKTLTPVVADRTQREPSTSLLEKLRRTVIEACKQSGRNHLMEIGDAVRSSQFFADTTQQNHPRWIAHPANESDSCSMNTHYGEIAKSVVAVGPEGGWTDSEVALAMQHGYECLPLGNRIYRIETAAVVIAARMLQ